MHKIPFVVVFLLFSGQFISAQYRQIPADTSVVSERETVIRGENVPYRVTVGTQPVWNDEGKVVAALHYTYYERTDVEDRSERPLMISFNGGPGSASVWMHLGYTGPYFLNIDPEGYPVQPYGVVPNEHSVLDATDILFVNPVNTGYSRILDPKQTGKIFSG